MTKNKPFRETLTEERDEALLVEYQNVITRYGETAPYLAKSKLYEEAARKFFITPGSARNIIQKLMRKKSRECQKKRS